MITSSFSNLTSQMQLASFLGLPIKSYIVRKRGNEVKMWQCLDHCQYHKGSAWHGDSADNFMRAENTVVQNYIAIL